MALRKTALALFGVFVASFYFVSGGRMKAQAIFEPPDDSEDAEPLEEGRFHPDITVLRKGSAAPVGSYMSQAIEDSNKLLSTILRNPQAFHVIQEQLAQKKTKRWAHYKTEGNPFKQGRARLVRDVERAAKLRLPDKHVSVFKKLRKRHACLTRRLQGGGDTTERSLAQERKHRCARSSDVGDKESETHTSVRYSKGNKRGKAEGDENDSVVTSEKEQVLKKRRKRAISAEKSDFLSPNPSPSLPSSLAPTTTAQKASLKRLKRSLSLFLTQDKRSEDKLLDNFSKTKEEGSRENTQTGTYRNKREAKKLSVQTIHLTLTALKTQEKLSTMVDHLSDPSNQMSKEEKFTYMQELLSELTAFVKLLHQQVMSHPQHSIRYIITTPTP